MSASASDRCLLAAAALAISLVGAPDTQAQLTAAEASKELRRGVKAAGSEARRRIRDATREVAAAIGSLGSADLGALEDIMKAFHGGLLSAMGALAAPVYLLTQDLLEELGAGGMLLGVYPKGFYQGDGGPSDAAQAVFSKEVDKALAKVTKEVRGLAARLEREARIGLSFHVQLPHRRLESYVNQGFAGSNFNELFLVYTYAYSALDAADDGLLCAGGLAPNTVATIEIEARGGHGDGTVAGTTTGVSPGPFWHHCLGPLQEGNYLVFVREQGDAKQQWIGVGVR